MCLDVLASWSVLVVGWPSPCPGAAQAPLTMLTDLDGQLWLQDYTFFC